MQCNIHFAVLGQEKALKEYPQSQRYTGRPCETMAAPVALPLRPGRFWSKKHGGGRSMRKSTTHPDVLTGRQIVEVYLHQLENGIDDNAYTAAQ